MGKHAEMAEKQFSPFLRQLYPISGIVLQSISIGCILGYAGVLLPQLKDKASTIRVDPDSASWIASIISFGSLNGIMIVPYCMTHCGRKLANTFGILASLSGWAFILMANSVPVLLLARYLQGISMGMHAPLAAVSMGEYSSPANRGGFLSLLAFSLATGMLVSHSFGCFTSWKNTAIASMSFGFFALLIIATSPESPSYLASKGKFEKCRKAFYWLRGNGIEDVEELEIMISKHSNQKPTMQKETFKSWSRNTLKILKKKEFYKPSVIVLVMFILMQWSGSNIIPNYPVDIMKSVSQNTLDPHKGMIIIDVVRFIATLVGSFSLRRFNARTVLFTSAITTCTLLLSISSYLYLRNLGYINLSHNWVPTSLMFVYVYVMTSGIYILPFSLIGELYPLAYKGLGGLVSGSIIAVTLFSAIKSAPYLFSSIEVHGAFLLYATVIAVSSTVLYYILPETRGKTLQQIEDNFKGIDTIKEIPELTKINS